MSVNARVVLLVEDDLTLYVMYQRKDRLSHYRKLTSLSAFGFILKGFFFSKPMSVNARVILEDDATLYTMVTIVPTKR